MVEVVHQWGDVPITADKVQSCDKTINESLHGQRCLLCLRPKRRSKGVFVVVNLSDSYGKHLAAVSLARRLQTKNETRNSHRFSGSTSRLIVCGNCNLIYSKLYKKLGFNPANTNFYRYFEDVESDSEEPSSGTSLQFAPEATTDATE